jgi:hypothetical protein
MNPDNQYSIWPSDRENPLGWEDGGKTGKLEDCLAYLNEIRENSEKPNAEGTKRETTQKGNSKVSVDVTATKTHLLKGENAVVTVTVKGLQEMKQARWLWIEKQGVVRMAGGDVQSIRIRPADVRPDGTFQVQRTVTGERAGGFDITATFRWNPWTIKLQESGGKNRRRVKKEGDSVLIKIEDAEDPVTGDPLDGEYVLEYPCFLGLNIKLLFPIRVKNGKGQATVSDEDSV